METLDAIMIIEGEQSETYEGQIIDAWQHLIDSAVVWRLQGSYRRAAESLIARGICNAPEWAEEPVPTS